MRKIVLTRFPPINFVDPTGLFAQGNPLNSLSLYAFAGGYSGGRVSAAPPPVYVSPTLNYNPLAAPTFSSQQLFGGTPTIKAPSSTLVPLAFPHAVNNAGISQSLANDLSRIQMGQHFAGVTNWLREGNLQAQADAARYRPAEGPSLLSQVGNVISSLGSGLTTGGKAVVNSLASTVTLGFYDGPAQVTRQDINNGYNAARFFAGVGTETFAGLATGGLSRMGAAGKAILAFDTASNAVNAGRGGLDAYNNGFSLGNTVQIVGGGLGLGGNIAAGGQALREIASDVGSYRVQFDPATLSAGGLGGVTIRNAHLAGDVHPVTKIPFTKKGFPDFSGVAIKTVRVQQSGNRYADEAAANLKSGFSSTPDGYTWHHHQGGKTMQLVPTTIHSATGHTGGVAIKKAGK